jgi:hypothetical protein
MRAAPPKMMQLGRSIHPHASSSLVPTVGRLRQIANVRATGHACLLLDLPWRSPDSAAGPLHAGPRRILKL